MTDKSVDAPIVEGADLHTRFQQAWIDRLTAERDSFRAVLEGAGYGDIDGIAKNTVEQSHALGETVKAITLDIIRRAEEARVELEWLRNLLEDVLSACDQGRMVERGAGGMTIEA